ncbi:MAG: hypothetical protein GYA17_04045 [Chloroflexi bacterium]|jgi:hypothetical protein|nr:hypothetical protein [Anaerolineaceae bacterium]NMB87507.1 hypothetical protein [Chloroflexota bacterium]
MNEKLVAPNETTYWLAVILGAIGIVGHFQLLPIPLLQQYDFWFITVGFLLLALSTSGQSRGIGG